MLTYSRKNDCLSNEKLGGKNVWPIGVKILTGTTVVEGWQERGTIEKKKRHFIELKGTS